MNNLISSLTGLIQNFYAITGLAGIAVAMLIESCCIPLPSEIIMPLAGAMLALSTKAGAKHLLGIDPTWPLWVNLVLIAVAGSVGSLAGSALAYGIGYAGGRPLILKYGKYVLISRHEADKADRFFYRWGSATAFFSRLLPVIRTYISLPAGITRMSFGKFCTYTFLGSLPWCVALAYLGYVLGNNYDKISQPLHYVDGLVVVLLVLLIVLYIWRHFRNERRARAEHAASEAEPAAPVENPWGQPPFSAQSSANQPSSKPVSPQPQQSWSQPARTLVPPQSQAPQGNDQHNGNHWRP